MKKGFTLVELLIVIVIIAVVTLGATISFSNINKDTAKENLKDNYVAIQRAASMYIDLNDSWLTQFANRREIFIRLSELKNTNYISKELMDPVINEEISTNYTVKLYITSQNGAKEKEYIDSCIVDIATINGDEIVKCIANNNGDACGCCDYNIDTINNPACK